MFFKKKKTATNHLDKAEKLIEQALAELRVCPRDGFSEEFRRTFLHTIAKLSRAKCNLILGK